MKLWQQNQWALDTEKLNTPKIQNSGIPRSAKKSHAFCVTQESAVPHDPQDNHSF